MSLIYSIKSYIAFNNQFELFILSIILCLINTFIKPLIYTRKNVFSKNDSIKNKIIVNDLSLTLYFYIKLKIRL